VRRWPGDEREEFGDAPQWNALAEKWYWWADDANERQLWGGYEMSIYASSGKKRQWAISQRKAHVLILEYHSSTPAANVV
jgi:hypothetical protein